MKVIVAGGRDFCNYPLLKERLDHYLGSVKEEITIVSGAARGADTQGELYAHRQGLKLERHPANWDRYGKSAGYKRNEEMAKVANACICFWDGQSRGTNHMIEIAKKYKLELRIVRY